MIFSAGVYELDDDPGRVDRDAVREFLSTQAYWGRFRTRADLYGTFGFARPDHAYLERPRRQALRQDLR